LSRALGAMLADERADCVAADASAIATRPAPAATRPASPALITLRRDRFTVRIPVRSRVAMGISSRN
jgi:hypothetical protein